MESHQHPAIHLIAKTLNLSPDTILPDSRIEHLCDDSIRLFELILTFEKQYEHKVNYTDLAHFSTVADIIAYVDGVVKTGP